MSGVPVAHEVIQEWVEIIVPDYEHPLAGILVVPSQMPVNLQTHRSLSGSFRTEDD